VAPVLADEAAAYGGEAGPRGIAPASLVPLLTDAEPAVMFVGRAPTSWTGDAWQPVVFVLNPDGTPRFAAVPDLPAGGVARLPGELVGAPVLQPEAGTNGQVVYGSRGGDVVAIPASAPDSAFPGFRWNVDVADTLSYGPVPGGGTELLLAVRPDQLLLLDEDGGVVGDPLALVRPGDQPAQRFAGAPSAAPVAGGDSRWVVPVEDGWFLVTADAEGLDPAPDFYPYPQALPDSVGVKTARLRGEEADALVLFTSAGAADVWQLGPQTASGPTPWPGAPDEALVAEPAVADLDGNGRDDVVLLTAERILACQAGGEPLTGFPLELLSLFPLADSTRVVGPVVVLDTDADPANEIYFGTSIGHLVGLEANGELVDRTPFRWGDGAAAGMAAGDWTDPAGRRILWLLNGGGYTGPPLDRHYQNGRLVGYALPGGRSEAGTSEWLAAAGGFARTGATGEARDLGAEAPLAQLAGDPILYPNPLRGDDVVLRFYSAGGAPAEVAVYNLEGEEVVTEQVPTVAGQMNEHTLTLPGLASGLYVCRVVHDAGGGSETSIITLAVER
jgi:hypothetical protein